jgi:MFS family permease
LQVPNKVRSGAIGIIMAMAHCGTALGFGASPGLIDSMGWGWTFYLFGGAALLWVPFWLSMAREKGNQAVRSAAAAMLTMQRQQAERSAVMVTAATAAVRQGSNNIVSTAGLNFARAGTGQADSTQEPSATHDHPILVALEQQQQQEAVSKQMTAAAAAANSTPQQQQQHQAANVGFWPLMRRKEVWAIGVAQYAAGWGFYGLLAWLPQFFIEHCGLQLSQLGGFTLAPYLLQAVMGASAGLLADNLIVKRKWGVRDVRVLMQVRRERRSVLCGLIVRLSRLHIGIVMLWSCCRVCHGC